eukprot:Nk52_evm35s294 gene=Nk52_evmTU35s294
MPPAQAPPGSGKEPTVIFDMSKKELCTPNSGFRNLHRRLKGNWNVGVIKDEISRERLSEADLVIFGGPREKFSVGEFDAIQQYMAGGGNVMIMIGEGGETRFNTNINYLLEEFGMMVNSDAVVRSVYYKYFHPKEALISQGVLNREFNRAAGKSVVTSTKGSLNKEGSSLSFLYPFGATIEAQKPAIPILSTGSSSFPLNRPVCAVHANKSGKGKLAVLGSVHMFSDQYLDKEENSKIFDVLLQWLTTSKIQLNQIDAEDPDVADYHFLPDTHELSDTLRSCLQESDDIPKDFTSLFNHSLFKLDTSVIPAAVQAYNQLKIKHEPLTLIQPQFETPLPPLQPAVFPPTFKELPPPSLDLFDLDEQFSSENARLAQITNKCTDEDLEYYVRECGEILGVTEGIPQDKRDAKHILEFIFNRVVEFKKLS